MGEVKRKRARDASNDEILPGGHGPAQSQALNLMRGILKTCQAAYLGFELTLFAFEPVANAEREGRLPRFNYASTVQRPDMLAVLRAFIAKQEAEAAKLDKINNAAPTGRAQ
jgi:hypothetical protein